jgi:hypothetical protein
MKQSLLQSTAGISAQQPFAVAIEEDSFRRFQALDDFRHYMNGKLMNRTQNCFFSKRAVPSSMP